MQAEITAWCHVVHLRTDYVFFGYALTETHEKSL